MSINLLLLGVPTPTHSVKSGVSKIKKFNPFYIRKEERGLFYRVVGIVSLIPVGVYLTFTVLTHLR